MRDISLVAKARDTASCSVILIFLNLFKTFTIVKDQGAYKSMDVKKITTNLYPVRQECPAKINPKCFCKMTSIFFILYFSDINQTIIEDSTDTPQDGQTIGDPEEDNEGNIFDVFDEEIPKKPPKLKDIDFFLPEVPEKANKTKKKKKSSKLSIQLPNESPDSSSESVDNSEATLRKLFEEYDPDKDSSDDDSQSSANEEEFKTTIHGDQDYILNNVTETVGAGSLKKRIAHDPSIEVCY